MVSKLEILDYALTSMRHRQLRSWLTISGIVIGIAAIVLLVSIGQGLDREIKGQLSAIGSKYVIILPGSPLSGGFSFGPPVFRGDLTQADADSIRRLPGVKSVSSAVVLGFANIAYKDEKVSNVVVGAEPHAMNDFLTVGFERGKYLAEGDGGGAVIGYNVAQTMFKDKIEYGKTININGRDFRVKGILKKGGSFSVYDGFVFIDIGAAREIGKTVGSKSIDRIFAIANSEADVPVAEEAIKREIARRHKVPLDKLDFSTNTAESISNTVGQITNILSIFLGLIAGISLIVGMVGIANSMFTSVLERTREIGILKAVGASERDITRIFLFEAALIGLAGGLIGALIGWGISALIGAAGGPSYTSIEFIAFALLLSVLVGMASGYLPARDAARLQPVEALRYE